MCQNLNKAPALSEIVLRANTFTFPTLVWTSVTCHQTVLTKAQWLISQLCHYTKNNRRKLFCLKEMISGETSYRENTHGSTPDRLRTAHTLLSSYLCGIRSYEMKALITSFFTVIYKKKKKNRPTKTFITKSGQVINV